MVILVSDTSILVFLALLPANALDDSPPDAMPVLHEEDEEEAFVAVVVEVVAVA